MQADDSPHPPAPAASADELWELHRRSWELELLISGAVIFSLFQIPSTLTQAIDWARAHVGQGSTREALMMALVYLESVVYVLAINLMLHFVLRAFWISLIGLGSAFPQGIRYEKLDYGPLYLDHVRRTVPGIEKLTRTVDRICNVIFSFTFTVILFLVLGIAFCTVAILGGGFIVRSVFGYRGEAGWLVLVLLLPYLLTYGLDKLAGRRIPGLLHVAWFRKLAAVVYRVYGTLFCLPLIGAISLVLLSNIPRRRVLAVLMLYLFSPVLVLTLILGAVHYDGEVYAPDDARGYGMDSMYYEDQWPQDKIVVTPSIPSDIIRGPFVRLFVPYRSADNDRLRERCPDLEPFAREGLRLQDGSEHPGPEADPHVRAAIECLAGFHELLLDGKPLEKPEFFFSTHPKSGMRGLVTYLPTSGLLEGRHLLVVKKRFIEHPRDYFIPFWWGRS
jgi:hypothetical protein